MVTREQERAIERLANAHGKVCVRTGFECGRIHVFVPEGSTYVIEEHGTTIDAGYSFSVDWNKGIER